MPTFTVIVPIYKVEKYIAKCITSILNQTFKDFELICVDDCSPDNSIKIVEELTKDDSRVKLLRQSVNKGVSAARNLGLDNATGKYVMFCDSDDWYEPDCLEVVKREFELRNTTTIWYDSYKYLDKSQRREDRPILRNRRGYLVIQPDNLMWYSDYHWVKAYTRESIEKYHIRFPEGIVFEEGEFYFKYFTYYPRTYIIENCLYNYRIREGSIVTNAQKGIVDIGNIYTVMYHMRDFYIENNLYDKYKGFIAQLLARTIKISVKIAQNRNEVLKLAKKLLDDFGYPKEFEFLKEKTDENKLVSVVVPFYNVEKYIEQCITSIQNQTYSDIEILCIDDCSPDKSIEIVERLAQKDKRIKIIRHDKNKGLGGARNTGLRNATGKYIFFVDSDDWLERECIEKVFRQFERTGYDTIWFKPRVLWESSGEYTDISPMFPYYAHCRQNFVTLDDTNLINFPLYSWNKAYDRQFLLDNDLFWRENVFFEDVEFYFKTSIKSPEIYIIDEQLYVYRRRNDSIISSATREVDKAGDLYFVATEVYKYLKANNLLGKYKNSFQKYTVDAMNMFRRFTDVHKKLLPIIDQFLKDINYPEEYIGVTK